MVKEQLRNHAKVFTVGLLNLTVNLEHWNGIISVDFVSWWTTNGASLGMSDQLILSYEEVETELANVESPAVVFFWKWWKVPCLTSVYSDLNKLYWLYLSCLLKFLNLFFIETKMFVIEKEFIVESLLFLLVFLEHFELVSYLILLYSQLCLINPSIVSPLQCQVVHIVLKLLILDRLDRLWLILHFDIFHQWTLNVVALWLLRRDLLWSRF